MSSDVISRFQEFAVNTNMESCTDMSDDEMPTEKDLGNGSRSRGRSRQRGQGRGRRGQGYRGSMCREEKPQKTDQERVEDRRKEKKKQAKELISEMEEEKLRELVLQLVDREPGIIFDLCEGIEDPPQTPPLPQPQQPSWCKCGRCRQMPTELERKCCQCLPRNCVSIRDEMERLVLDPQVLALGQQYHREMLGRYGQRVDNYNQSMRYAGYRNFILWRHRRLGAGVRRVIPSCCVWTIRDRYPSAMNQYTGFIPNRFI